MTDPSQIPAKLELEPGASIGCDLVPPVDVEKGQGQYGPKYTVPVRLADGLLYTLSGGNRFWVAIRPHILKANASGKTVHIIAGPTGIGTARTWTIKEG